MGTRVSRKNRPVRVSGAWYDSPWRIAGHAVGTALALVLIGLVLSLAVVPRLSGGASLTVLTGSMEPTFAPGDVIVVRGVDAADVCAEVGVGEIVTFFPEPNDPALISHRVIGKTIGTFDDGTSCRLVTQGDANSAVDEPVSPEQVRGVFQYGVPKLGWVRQWVGDNIQAVVVVAALALVALGIASGTRKPRTRIYAAPGGTDGPAGPGGVPVDVAPAPAAPAPAVPALDAEDLAHERALRERDLDLRERELELRERELELARLQAGPAWSDRDLHHDLHHDLHRALDLGPDVDVRAEHDPQPPTAPVPVPASLPAAQPLDRIEA
ncbi:signal peptidase I [Cellulomonas sp. PS-H5]|uniref:signal peptidase I n=1 Tax=Cellulomonas sp. PS-H5 TaxID=2820400 RepID=UPI001C4E85AF|nr:signal peptidase I [Cellulomonas sp. PS-H5]MBW0253971.1 signal peptidase I [Cellulomonas sp. PS-H5]